MGRAFPWPTRSEHGAVNEAPFDTAVRYSPSKEMEQAVPGKVIRLLQ
jgi:hypothetical protein